MRQPPNGFSLRLDENLCNTLVNSIRGIVWEADSSDFRFNYVSPQAERVLGYPVQQWIEEPDFWLSHTHPEDAAWCADYCRKATDRGEDHEFEYRMIAADGRVVWLHDIVTVVSNDGGSLRLRGIMIDITDSKLAEMRIRTGEERFRLAVEGANDGIWDWDLAANEVYYSSRWKSMLGYRDDELANHPDTWSQLIHPDELENVLTLVRDYVSGRSGKFETEYRMRHKCGGYITVLSRALLARNKQGEASRLVGTHVDITPLKQAEDKLHLAQICLDWAPIGFLRISSEGRILEANDFTCKSLGYSRQELRSMFVFDFDPEFTAEMWPAHLERLKEAKTMCFETTHMAKNGSAFPMEISAAWLEYNGNECIYSFEKDLSERRKAQLAMEEQEELHRIMVDQAPDGVVLVDAETLGFKEFNDMACNTLGYRREEFARLTALDINAEFPRKDHLLLKEAFRTKGHVVFETLHRHRSGSLRNTRVSLRVVRIRGQQYFLAFWTDITDQVRLNEKLTLREHYQRALLDNFPYAVWMKDEAGRYLAANRKLAEFLGLEHWQDMLGKTNDDLLPPELCRHIAEEDRMVLATGQPKHAEELLPIQGKPHWFAVYQSPVTINGRKIGTVGCNWDITEQKLVSQALAESEERYRKLVELSPDGVYIHHEGRFVFMNTTGATLLGVETPEELYGRSVLDFVHPDYRQKVNERISHAAAHRKNPAVEMILVRADGSKLPVEMVSVYFNYRNTDSVLAVARDISERKRMQDELVKAQRLESLGVLAGGIAHDFNNILTGILGNISLMRYQLDADSPLAERLKCCEQAAIRASELTQQLLTFARGGAPIKKLMDPRSLIRESATFLFHGSNIGCKLRLAEYLWHIKADSGQISQVLHNILFNAMQAMPEGGMVLITAVNNRLLSNNTLSLPSGDYLQVDIEDQGCGIPAENLPKIFDPYFSTKSEGNGLGLASVYSVIKRHGGAIEVFSTVGEGTRFSLFLPAVSGDRSQERPTVRPQILSGSGRILLMDDEPIIREVATKILTSAGYHVESCSDGNEAVQLYQAMFGSNSTYDAVIMDLTVPGGMGGREAAAHILETDPNACLIVSSGYSNDPVVADFRNFGFTGVVIKPFSAAALLEEMERLVPVKHKIEPSTS